MPRRRSRKQPGRRARSRAKPGAALTTSLAPSLKAYVGRAPQEAPFAGRHEDVDRPVHSSRPRPSDAAPPFVISHEDDRWSGYRRDIGEHALATLGQPGWIPQHRVDLHGHRAARITGELRAELGTLFRLGLRRVLVIHGRGTHSPGGLGVLAEVVVEVLTEPPIARLVRAFRTAPPRLGGRGALCVELQEHS